MLKNILILIVLLLGSSAVQTAYAQNDSSVANAGKFAKNSMSESQKIEHLIASLRNMEGAVFIRNGSEHSAQEAAEHLKAKWEKHRSKIKTANDFIEHLATKSSMSGELYKIRFADGKTVPTAEVLNRELNQVEATKAQ